MPTLEEHLKARRDKAIAAGSVACPFCELGYEVYTIANDVFKCSICGEHPVACPTPVPSTST